MILKVYVTDCMIFNWVLSIDWLGQVTFLFGICSRQYNIACYMKVHYSCLPSGSGQVMSHWWKSYDFCLNHDYHIISDVNRLIFKFKSFCHPDYTMNTISNWIHDNCYGDQWPRMLIMIINHPYCFSEYTFWSVPTLMKKLSQHGFGYALEYQIMLLIIVYFAG